MVSADELLVIGGNDGPEHFASTEMLNLADMDTVGFRSGPQMASKRTFCTAVKLDDKQVLVIGGSKGWRRTCQSCEILRWENVMGKTGIAKFDSSENLDVPRSQSAAVFVPSLPSIMP